MLKLTVQTNKRPFRVGAHSIRSNNRRWKDPEREIKRLEHGFTALEECAGGKAARKGEEMLWLRKDSTAQRLDATEVTMCTWG